MKLSTINRWLRRIGLVLVIRVEYDGRRLTTPTRLWIMTVRAFNKKVLPADEFRLQLNECKG